MSKCILAFDLMDTVVVDPFYREIPKLFAAPLERMMAHRDQAAWPAFERNEIDEPTFMRRFYRADAPAGLPTAEQVRQVVHDGYRFVDGMPELLQRLLRQGQEVWIFSNYPVWFEVVRTRLRLDAYFRDYVVSFQTGVRKPEPAAYHAFCNRVAHSPQRCLLIDDRPINVEGARAAGMSALRFERVEQLTADLQELGLLCD